MASGESVVRMEREITALRAENARLSRLLDLRGQIIRPDSEQLAAPVRPPGLVTRYSVILERVDDMIDTRAMLQEVRAWIYSPGRFDDGVAALPLSYLPGLRDELEDAAGEGLLTREEFARVVRHE